VIIEKVDSQAGNTDRHIIPLLKHSSNFLHDGTQQKKNTGSSCVFLLPEEATRKRSFREGIERRSDEVWHSEAETAASQGRERYIFKEW